MSDALVGVSVKLAVVIVVGSIARENVAVTAELRATAVAAFAGEVEQAVGAVGVTSTAAISG